MYNIYVYIYIYIRTSSRAESSAKIESVLAARSASVMLAALNAEGDGVDAAGDDRRAARLYRAVAEVEAKAAAPSSVREAMLALLPAPECGDGRRAAGLYRAAARVEVEAEGPGSVRVAMLAMLPAPGAARAVSSGGGGLARALPRGGWSNDTGGVNPRGGRALPRGASADDTGQGVNSANDTGGVNPRGGSADDTGGEGSACDTGRGDGTGGGVCRVGDLGDFGIGARTERPLSRGGFAFDTGGGGGAAASTGGGGCTALDTGGGTSAAAPLSTGGGLCRWEPAGKAGIATAAGEECTPPVLSGAVVPPPVSSAVESPPPVSGATGAETATITVERATVGGAAGAGAVARRKVGPRVNIYICINIVNSA